MRNFLLVLVCLSCAAGAFSQTTTRRYGRIEVAITKQKHPKMIFATVLNRPDTIVVDSAWVRSLENSINQSLSFKNGARPGNYRVTAQFVMDKDSIISDVRCIDDPGYGMGEAVVRALKKGMIRWKPAQPEGVKVREYRH
jgi:periplasmic protein TonB